MTENKDKSDADAAMYENRAEPAADQDPAAPVSAAALQELEAGLTAAADGPPHKVDEDSEDSEDGEDGPYTANSSSSSLDTEEAVAFALERDGEEEEDGAGGQEEHVPSSDLANFRGAREASRNSLKVAAYFADTARDMLSQHDRARKDADICMAEVM